MRLLEPLTKPPPSVTDPTHSGTADFWERSQHKGRPFWQPPRSTSVKLLATGATVGTLVDSLHNQILLEYHLAPIQVPSLINPEAHWLASSWTVPPLLAVAYLVLGGILPRLVQKAIQSISNTNKNAGEDAPTKPGTMSSRTQLSNRAIWAVTTTAMIVKLSDILERHPSWDLVPGVPLDVQHLMILFSVALVQWWTLDRTLAAFILAAVTAYGGPLAELPFIAANVWTYLPDAANYMPLQGDGWTAQALRVILQDRTDLAISTVSAPCYFAVCMDAIALGRWFDAQHENDENSVL